MIVVSHGLPLPDLRESDESSGRQRQDEQPYEMPDDIYQYGRRCSHFPSEGQYSPNILCCKLSRVQFGETCSMGNDSPATLASSLRHDRCTSRYPSRDPSYV